MTPAHYSARVGAVAAACVLFTLAGPVRAHAPTTLTDDPPALTLSPTVTVAQLLDLSAQQFGVDIEYNPTDAPLTAKLNLRSAAGYTPDELWELTQRMLETRGRTTVLAPGGRRLYRVVPLAEAAGATEAVEAVPHPEPGYIVLRYSLRHADPGAVLAALNEPRPP